jgi:hypothetical protein
MSRLRRTSSPFRPDASSVFGTPPLPSVGSGGSLDFGRATNRSLLALLLALPLACESAAPPAGPTNDRRVVRGLAAATVEPEDVVRDEEFWEPPPTDAPPAVRAADPRRGGVRTVDLALDWLARRQSRDGSWNCDGFPATSDPQRAPPAEGKGQDRFDVGVTGLALLAFLGAGHTHREGGHRETVRNGLHWLRNQQDADGRFGPRGSHVAFRHGIAALAMVDAWGMTKSGVWRSSAQKGIDFVAKSQDASGAWRYDSIPSDRDVVLTGWMCMALKSAQLAGGLTVPDEPLRSAHAFVRGLTDPETGRTGYVRQGERPLSAVGTEAPFPDERTEAATAAGMLIRIFGGENPEDSPMLKAGAELLLARPSVREKDSGGIDMDSSYYGTLAMFQMGGAAWSRWHATMVDAIVKSQLTDGELAGSWDKVDAWGEDGGRVAATAVMTMCLEVYYRFDRFEAK